MTRTNDRSHPRDIQTALMRLSGICLVVGILFSGVPAADAQVATMEWAVVAEIEPYAELTLENGELVVPYVEDGEGTATTGLTVMSNVPYTLNAQWLDSNPYSGPHPTSFWFTDGLDTENPAGIQTGTFGVGIMFPETTSSHDTGDDTGALASETGIVNVADEPEGENWSGTVILTLFAQ